MTALDDESVDLVVTSPPYPMIEMWDESFGREDPGIGQALSAGNGTKSFELMHQQLDKVWNECARVLKPGTFLCVNIGDATRKVGDNFRLYSNHSRIVSHCERLGFQSLPLVLWRKQTNAPNKFMGSGMLPSGAYVTLEHEYVLILRMGGKRSFNREEARHRRESAFFWEERNSWFSDIWDFKGTRQLMVADGARSRSAAFPLELVHRLVNMYSVQGDVVLDPFLGTGTTLAAGILNGRCTVGFEVIESLSPVVSATVATIGASANSLVDDRLKAHITFVEEYEKRKGKPLGYRNENYGFPVMTNQETALRLLAVSRLEQPTNDTFVCEHRFAPVGIGMHEPSITLKSGIDSPAQIAFSFNS